MLPREQDADIIFAFLASSLGYWWWAVASDGFNLKKWLLERFPLSTGLVADEDKPSLAALGARLWNELRTHYVFKDNRGRVGNYYLPDCNELVLEIDSFLATHVQGLTPSFFSDIQSFNTSFSRTSREEDGNPEDDE